MQDREKLLKEELSKSFSGDSRVMTMFAKLIIALIKIRTVSYSRLSLLINDKVQVSSNFKRIQRFVRTFEIPRGMYINFVWSLFVKDAKQITLSLDRTDWKFGKHTINIFLVSISYKGTALPLLWHTLDKRGISSQAERITLFEELFSYLSEAQQQQISCLVADREFIGEEWVAYLLKQPYDFYLRIRSNILIEDRSATKKKKKYHSMHVRELFQSPSMKILRKPRYIFGAWLYLSGRKNAENDYFILVTNTAKRKVVESYKQRWGIEVFFGCSKKRGFNIEDTHVSKPERIATILFLIAIAFCWALKTGEKLVENGYKIPVKSLENRRELLFSIFRVGLDKLTQMFFSMRHCKLEIQLLSCT